MANSHHGLIIEVVAPGETPPEGKILFFDDFEDGPDPAWAPSSGTWIVTKEGRYTVQEKEWKEHTYTYVKKGRLWRNYAVEVDIYGANMKRETMMGTYHQGSGIIVRARDDLNKILLLNVSDEYLCWRVIKDGEHIKSCVNKVTPGLPAKAHIRVKVVGNIFEAYVNGIKRTTLKLEEDIHKYFKKGMPGLYISYNMGVTFDDFKVTSLGD